MVGVTAISNNLIDCGFHLTSGSANFYDSFYLEGNTVDGEELLYIQNGSGFDLIGDGARQIYIVNSDNFTISDYSQDEEKNYPVINLISCRDGTISDSNFIGGNPSLQIKYSENIEVFNNSILGGMQSMYLYGCLYISIYNNWFESSNLSFSDNSENHWDNGKIGNYWRNLSLTDENEDGFADTVVNIPGGTSVDRFPLVPGISLGVEPFLEYGTTGEDIPVTITAENLNLEMINSISFYYGNSTDGYQVIQLDPEASVQIAYVQIPSDSTDTIEIWVNVSDTIGGYKESPIILFEVLDNDRPTYSIEDLPDEIGNNETVEIVVSALDNIGVKSVKASFHSVDGNYSHDLILIDGKWMFNFTTDPYLTQTYQFRMIVEDHAGNNATSEYFTIITVDTVPPILVQDLTVEEADSGETIQFKVLIEDHSNISKALVEYRQIDHYGELTLDPDNFSVNYTVPIDDISPLYYRFIFEDANGNRLTTDERVIEIIDSISPVITVSDYSMVSGTGEKLEISFSIQDNIGVNLFYSIVRINGEMVSNLTTGDGFSVDIPIDVIGKLVFEITAFDSSMNIASFISEPITIIDVIKPEITVTAPSVGRVGEEIIISYDASDNIGIDSVSCEQGVVDEINNEISIIPDSAGEMAISILVVDESGNSLIYNMTIFIEEEAVIVDPDNTSFPLILIIPAVLLLIILLITFIIWKRRRMPSDIGEGEPEE